MTEPGAGVLRDADLAWDIAKTAGLQPTSVMALECGSVNYPFRLDCPDGAYVVRFAKDPLRANDFENEGWALQRAAAAGVPSPEVVCWGELEGVPFIVEGANGLTGPPELMWRTLGEYARVISGIAIDEHAPEDLRGDLSAGWRERIDDNLSELRDADRLIQLGVYSLEQQPQLRGLFTLLADSALTFGLCHGDLAPWNLLLPDSGEPVLLDWLAAVGPTPHSDMVDVLRWSLANGSPDERELKAFAQGCGFDLAAGRELLEGMAILKVIDLVRWSIDRRPDQLAEYVEKARAMIAGLL